MDEQPLPLAALPTEYTYDDGNGLTVTAIPGDPSSIPEGAELHADRITQESNPDSFAQFRQLLMEENPLWGITTFSVYDIYFLCDGEEIEPAGGTVSVTIVDTMDTAIAPEDAQVFHILNEDSAPELQELPVELTADAAAAAETDTAVSTLAETDAAASPETADLTVMSTDSSDTGQGITFTTDSFSAFAVAPDLPAGSPLAYYQIPSANAQPFTNTGYYSYTSRALGIAGYFHLVGFDTVNISGDVCGNILAKNLYDGVGFWTKNLPDIDGLNYSEVSYIQKFMQVNNNSGGINALLAIGSENTVGTGDGGTSFTIMGTKLNNVKEIWQDHDTDSQPFINLTKLQGDMGDLSQSLAGMSAQGITAHTDLSYHKSENYITLNIPDSVGVYNITANDLVSGRSTYIGGAEECFSVKGFTSDTSGTVIINVDCSALSSGDTIKIPGCTPFIDSSEKLTGEVVTFGNGRILWNFYGMDGNKAAQFTGTVAIAGPKEVYASFLAPYATVTCNVALNGTIIGNNVTKTGPETHRDDFVGKFAFFSAKKTWEGETADKLDKLKVTVELFDENGTSYGQAVLTSGNGWTHNWSNLPSGSHTYTVREIAVILVDGGTETDVTNQYTSTTSYSGSSCTICNTKSYVLPNTGGAGTFLYTAGGLSLMLAAASVLFLQKRKLRREVQNS